MQSRPLHLLELEVAERLGEVEQCAALLDLLYEQLLTFTGGGLYGNTNEIIINFFKYIILVIDISNKI